MFIEIFTQIKTQMQLSEENDEVLSKEIKKLWSNETFKQLYTNQST